MTDVKRPATGARAYTPCKDLSKAVDGGRIQCAVLHVPLSLPTNEGGERDGQPVCALLTALACDLLETTRTTTGGGCELLEFSRVEWHVVRARVEQALSPQDSPIECSLNEHRWQRCTTVVKPFASAAQ